MEPGTTVRHRARDKTDTSSVTARPDTRRDSFPSRGSLGTRFCLLYRIIPQVLLESNNKTDYFLQFVIFLFPHSGGFCRNRCHSEELRDEESRACCNQAGDPSLTLRMTAVVGYCTSLRMTAQVALRGTPDATFTSRGSLGTRFCLLHHIITQVLLESNNKTDCFLQFVIFLFPHSGGRCKSPACP